MYSFGNEARRHALRVFVQLHGDWEERFAGIEGGIGRPHSPFGGFVRTWHCRSGFFFTCQLIIFFIPPWQTTVKRHYLMFNLQYFYDRKSLKIKDWAADFNKKRAFTQRRFASSLIAECITMWLNQWHTQWRHKLIAIGCLCTYIYRIRSPWRQTT